MGGRRFDDQRLFRALAQLVSLRVGREGLEEPALSTDVVPVIPIESLLWEVRGFSSTPDLSGVNTTFFPSMTVPLGYRFYLVSYFIAATAGAHQLAVRINDSANPPALVNVRTGLSQTAAETLKWNPPLILEEGDQLGTFQTGNVGDTAIRTDVLYYRVRMARGLTTVS